MGDLIRFPMNHATFTARITLLRQRFPGLVITSGFRFDDENKHGLDIARDFKDYGELYFAADVVAYARETLGLW